jgi:hypothetical protein
LSWGANAAQCTSNFVAAKSYFEFNALCNRGRATRIVASGGAAKIRAVFARWHLSKRAPLISREVGVRPLFIAGILILASVLTAHAQDFGVVHPNVFFTKLDSKGQPIWQLTVEKELRARGFSAAQAAKFSKLGLLFEEDKTRSTFMMESLPIRFNPETGAKLPPDPIKFAAGLPDCFKADERDCEMKYSVNVGTNMPG